MVQSWRSLPQDHNAIHNRGSWLPTINSAMIQHLQVATSMAWLTQCHQILNKTLSHIWTGPGNMNSQSRRCRRLSSGGASGGDADQRLHHRLWCKAEVPSLHAMDSASTQYCNDNTQPSGFRTHLGMPVLSPTHQFLDKAFENKGITNRTW